METKKCDYCGKEYGKELFGTLDNGSNACYNCIKEEEISMKKFEKKKR